MALPTTDAELAAYYVQTGLRPPRGSEPRQPVALVQRDSDETVRLPSWPYRSRTEQRYALYLDLLQHEHQVHRWEYEPFKLRLGGKCFYTPDFLVIWELQPKELYLMEVKGYWRDDARVKIKVAAKQHSYFHFVAVEWIKGQWKEEQF